jgi:PAS domain S-box-containing protein
MTSGFNESTAGGPPLRLDAKSLWRLIDSLPLPIVVRDAAGDVVAENEALRERPQLRAAFAGSPAREQDFVDPKSGQRQTWAFQNLPVDQLTASIAFDVTELRAIQRGIAHAGDSERLDAATFLIAVLDSRGSIVNLNRAFELVTGYSSSEVKGTPFWNVFPSRALTRVARQRFEEMLATGQPIRLLSRWKTRTGERRTVALRVSPVRTASGDLQFVLCTGVDLTDRVRAERALRQSERQFRLLWEQSVDGIRLTDPAHRVVMANPAFCALVGRRRDELEGSLFWEIHSEAEQEALRCLHEELFQSPEAKTLGRYPLVRPDGSSVILEATCKVVRFPGRGPMLLTMARDVTRVVAQEQELRKAKEAAEAASAAKSEFLANISHEIRTPLNAVVGLADILLQSPLGATEHEQVERLKAAAGVLRNLIDDLLDFSKADAGRMQLESVEFSLREHVESAFDTLANKASEKGLRYTMDIDSGLPDQVIGDPFRMRQVLINLIGNGVKFTQSGSVAIRVMEVFRPDELVGVRFEIEDTGIGIEPEKQALIFEPFRQADGSTTRKYGGTGLGLTISARLVEMMGGRLTCTSEPGKGSLFSFEIALPVATMAEPHSAGQPVSVLIAEDNATNQELLTRMLVRKGHHVTVASTGEEAVEKWREVSPALILMDVQMPERDGIAATRAIREAERQLSRKPVAIVAMTANVTEEDRMRCLEAGMDSFLTKPAQWKELEKVLQDASEAAPFAAPVEAAKPLRGNSPILNLDQALSRVGGDRDLLREVALLFLDSYPDDLEKIRIAIAAGDAHSLERSAHSLKGSVANFAADTAVRLAFDLEKAGRAGDLGGAPALCAELEQELERLGPQLRAL